METSSPRLRLSEALLAIEGQSRKHHTGAQWARHNQRLNALAEHGRVVMNATWDMLADDCRAFFELVRKVRTARLAHLAPGR